MPRSLAFRWVERGLSAESRAAPGGYGRARSGAPRRLGSEDRNTGTVEVEG